MRNSNFTLQIECFFLFVLFLNGQNTLLRWYAQHTLRNLLPPQKTCVYV